MDDICCQTRFIEGMSLYIPSIIKPNPISIGFWKLVPTGGNISCNRRVVFSSSFVTSSPALSQASALITDIPPGPPIMAIFRPNGLEINEKARAISSNSDMDSALIIPACRMADSQIEAVPLIAPVCDDAALLPALVSQP